MFTIVKIQSIDILTCVRVSVPSMNIWDKLRESTPCVLTEILATSSAFHRKPQMQLPDLFIARQIGSDSGYDVLELADFNLTSNQVEKRDLLAAVERL